MYVTSAAPMDSDQLAGIRSVLEEVTLADLVSGDLPKPVVALTAEPDAWAAR